MDALKPIDEICTPDPRWGYFVGYSGEPKQALEQYHARVREILLHESVPEPISQHFETAKNLLLYAWFAYRFIPVAEMQAYASLEFALRWRYHDGCIPESSKITLGRLISLAISNDWVKNEGFSAYRHHQRTRARDDYLHGKIEEAREKGLKEMPLADYHDDFEGVIADPEYDYLGIIKDSIRVLRNELAHGSTFLHPGGAATLGLCAEFINQLFPAEDTKLGEPS